MTEAESRARGGGWQWQGSGACHARPTNGGLRAFSKRKKTAASVNAYNSCDFRKWAQPHYIPKWRQNGTWLASWRELIFSTRARGPMRKLFPLSPGTKQ